MNFLSHQRLYGLDAKYGLQTSRKAPSSDCRSQQLLCKNHILGTEHCAFVGLLQESTAGVWRWNEEGIANVSL